MLTTWDTRKDQSDRCRHQLLMKTIANIYKEQPLPYRNPALLIFHLFPRLTSPQRRPRHLIIRQLLININQNPLIIRLIQRRPQRPRRQRLGSTPRNRNIITLRIILCAVLRGGAVQSMYTSLAQTLTSFYSLIGREARKVLTQ